MICPKRTSELLDLHLAPFKDKDPAWEIGVSKIAGRGVMATRALKRGEIIFTDSPLLIGLAALEEDSLNACSVCFKALPDTRFMCRQGCGLPVCNLCGKKKQHKTDCDLFKSWAPNEPDVANSVIIRLLCVARAINLTKDQRDLIYCLQANLDNNHRTEVRNAAKCFKSFPTDKKVIEIMNRTVAVLRTDGFDKTTDRTNDNQEFFYRALFPLFAVMNHDCIPNSYYTFDEKTNNMIVRAAVDIAEGAEITTTYTKLFTGNIARHLFLKMKKGFSCKCPRCSDPTERNAFISALYCRDTNCSGLVVPEITGLPHPNWNCLACKQKSTHAQMMKSQDFASGAINAKVNSNSLRTLVQYLNEKSDSFIPNSNYVIIDAKMAVLNRLNQGREDCSLDLANETRVRYSRDIMEIMDKLGLGDSILRSQLETKLRQAEEKQAKKLQAEAEKQAKKLAAEQQKKQQANGQAEAGEAASEAASEATPATSEPSGGPAPTPPAASAAAATEQA
ncbi:SET domain-containing protein SmydA-8 [Scaptodrosophila lebanonensis]|uniref:SET domain-containing protein SmydA-8 n=1 Tax=Drosophila lebanonensis TaxID=7225 RepID=A0A6J2U539_DROLE|nr:SET domain-containing protein SmydA-8 [Scaptodrosophila lebanonensis]